MNKTIFTYMIAIQQQRFQLNKKKKGEKRGKSEKKKIISTAKSREESNVSKCAFEMLHAVKSKLLSVCGNKWATD